MPVQDTARSILAVELPSGSQLSETDSVTEGIVNRLKKRSEVKSVFVDGGRIPPATAEVRKAALTINYVPKDDRKLSQRQLELEIGRELQDTPDIRYWFLDENGKRAVTYVVTGADSATVANVAAEFATQMRRVADRHQRGVVGRARPAGTAHPPAARSRGASRHFHRKPVGDDPRRDHRRRRRRRSPSSMPATA